MSANTDELTVLFVAPHISYPGNTGGSVHLTEVTQELGEHVDLHVICDCDEQQIVDGVTYHPVDCGRFSLRAFPTVWRFSKDADIIHSRADPFELAGPVAAKLRGLPIVGEVNVNFLSYEKKHSLRDLFYPVFHLVKWLWLKLVVKRLDHVVCVSRVIKDELVDLGFDPDTVTVMHNGGNPARFEGVEQNAARNELGLPENDYIVLLMGELGPRHGLDTLIETEMDDVTFLVVGGRKKYADYIADIQENAADNFVFHDPVPYERIANHIVASDVVVAPYDESDNSHPFGFCPIKILDGMAAGKPVVASDRPWIKEILSNDEGVVTDDIAAGIRELENDKAREKKGKNALEAVQNRFSWTHTADRLLGLYHELIGVNDSPTD